ncbi:unnamed protein product [Linum tenue]|uniref:Uncharacterized protein n=1 Tax=Linum tenue TaxID=586396 RepID=A0AAV0MAH3_9ROSI|nr:unnamed protein product [Linum tenue]
MSWLKSAVSKAVEVGNKNNLTRAVKNYADTVVHQAGQAVAGGAKILQDRIVRTFLSLSLSLHFQATRNFKSAKQTIKRLEEAAVSCRGQERALLMRRWLAVLKEAEKSAAGSSEDNKLKSLEQYLLPDDAREGPRKVNTILYYDADVGGEPLPFRDIFLQSQALEGITLSMILHSPNEDEIALLLELFGLCLTGGKEVHIAILSSIQDLATVFTKYKEEVLVKREELLQFVQGAITGLKINAEMVRIDAEAVDLKNKLDGITVQGKPTNETEDKLVRSQKEEALKVRISKADEANEKEKEIGAEITVLEKERDELEAQLKKVNISLSAANARLNNAREERDQFEEANNQIIEHLKAKEDELTGSIAACKVESDVLGTWVNFLEDTWVLQRSYVETIEKQAADELEKHEEYFTNLAVNLLSDYKNELEPSIGRIGTYVENLKKLSPGSEVAASADNQDSQVISPRRHLEEEYMDYEAKIVTTFSVVDNMREQFYAQKGASSRKHDERVKELFDEIEKLRQEFDAIDRPILEVEVPSSKQEATSEEKSSEVASTPTAEPLKAEPSSPKPPAELPKKPATSGSESGKTLDAEAELAKLESEFGKVDPTDYSAEEVGEWEFDELERELRAGYKGGK